MSKTKKNYEGMYSDRQERDELEKLNRQTKERLSKYEEALWQQVRQMEEARHRQKIRNEATAKLVFTIVMAMPVTAAFMILAYAGVFAWWLASCLVGTVVGLSAFRSGCLWHEIKRN